MPDFHPETNELAQDWAVNLIAMIDVLVCNKLSHNPLKFHFQFNNTALSKLIAKASNTSLGLILGLHSK